MKEVKNHKYIDSWSLSLDNGGLKKDVFIDKTEIVVQLGHRPSKNPLRGLLLTLLLWWRLLRLLRRRLLRRRRTLCQHDLRLLLLQKWISLEAAGSQRSRIDSLNQFENHAKISRQNEWSSALCSLNVNKVSRLFQTFIFLPKNSTLISRKKVNY